MTQEEALKAFEEMYGEIDKENWLFIGTINPQMVEHAIQALSIIRCKDCRWWSPNRETCIEWADYCFRESKNCVLTHFSCRESDYCSWARGKKNETRHGN